MNQRNPSFRSLLPGLSGGLAAICLLLLLFSSTQVRGQVFSDEVFRDRAAAGLELIYNFRFEAANRRFQSMQSRYPDHPAPDFLLALNRWWQSYISESTIEYHDFIEIQLQLALEKNTAFGDLAAYELEYTFFQYMCYAFIARLHILKKEYWRAANAGRKALPYLKQGFRFQERSPEFYFSSGIYHYYAEVYPRDHPIVRPLMIFFPDGNAASGLEELERAGRQPGFAQVEAMYYLTDIYLNQEKDPYKANQMARRLASRFPDNTWFQAGYAETLIALGAYTRAAEILAPMKDRFETMARHGQQQINSLHSTLTSQVMMRVYHYLGQVIFKEKRNNARAEFYFQKSLKMAGFAAVSAHQLLPANHYFLGRCYDRENRREEALASYRKALRMDKNSRIKAEIKKCIDTPCVN